ncbi:Snf7-domain-containing protein [Scheffersomyces amazonensis]|uniref:Snf7-domain-containing protein n=1 Tax=Scheffersomyces amazonensis TaxID=1078765 RepID=UPI00315D24C6
MGIDIESIIKSNKYFKESRLRSLYSDFEHQKHLNPEGYEANITAWNDLLRDLLQTHVFDDSVVSFPTYNPDLATLLKIPIYGKPLSLGIILRELVKSHSLIPYSYYNSGNQSYLKVLDKTYKLDDYLSPTSWIKWGLTTVGLGSEFNATTSNGELKHERYISWDLLTKVGNEIWNRIESDILQMGTHSCELSDNQRLFDFMKKVHPTLTKFDCELILTYLSRDVGKCKLLRQDNKVFIKFSSGNITKEDIGIINLETSLFNINKRNEQLEGKIKDIDQKLKESFQINNKGDKLTRQRHLLRLRKILQSSLNHSLGSYNELHQVLLKINDSTQNINVYEQLVSSTFILKDLNASVDFANIEEVKQELQSEFEKSDEISEALGKDLRDDVDIEQELQALDEEVNGSKSESAQAIDSESSELIDKLKNLNIDTTKPKVSESPVETKRVALSVQDHI